MPRPDGGYRNAAGDVIPGVNDITRRYDDQTQLTKWKEGQAYQRGLAGVPNVEDDTARKIGTAVHEMTELDLRGAPRSKIEAVPGRMLSTRTDMDLAFNSFRVYETWKAEHDIRTISMEENLISEEFQFGGTPDVIAWVDGVRSLIDFKTCKAKNASRVYLGQRIAMAAHSHLWLERHPAEAIEAYHLINLPKDGRKAAPHSYGNLDREWCMFMLQRELWGLEKGDKPTRKTKAAKPSKKLVIHQINEQPDRAHRIQEAVAALRDYALSGRA